MLKTKNFKKRTEKTGFTLLELIVTIFVVVIGLAGIYAVFSQITAYTAVSSLKLTASYLVQEGIEVVRNIRDTNWLEESVWNDGLNQGEWEADYNDNSLTFYQGRYLQVDEVGGYSYDSGSQTKFKRKIIIQPSGDALKILVSVEWTEKGKNYKIEAQEDLQGWFKEQL